MSLSRLLTRTALATAVVSAMAGTAFAQTTPAASPAATEAIQPAQDAVQAPQKKMEHKADDATSKMHSQKEQLKKDGAGKETKVMPETAQKGGKSAEHRMDDVKKQHGKMPDQQKPAQ